MQYQRVFAVALFGHLPRSVKDCSPHPSVNTFHSQVVVGVVVDMTMESLTAQCVGNAQDIAADVIRGSGDQFLNSRQRIAWIVRRRTIALNHFYRATLSINPAVSYTHLTLPT